MVMCPCPSDGCRSVFHDSCAKRWFQTSSSCPLCRNTFPRLHNLQECYLQSPALVRALLTSSLEGRGGHPAMLFGAAEDLPPQGGLPRMLGFIDEEHTSAMGPSVHPPVRLTRPFRPDDLGGGHMEVNEDLATLVTLLALSPPNVPPPPPRQPSNPPVRERPSASASSASASRSSWLGSMPRAPTLPRAPRMPRAPSWFSRRRQTADGRPREPTNADSQGAPPAGRSSHA